MRCRRIALSRNHGGGLRWLIELTLTMRNRFRDESIAEAWLLLAGEDDDGRRRKAGGQFTRQAECGSPPATSAWLFIDKHGSRKFLAGTAIGWVQLF